MARPSKHDGVLYKRTGSKIWWMRYRDRDGKRYLETTNTEEWQQAQQKLRERLQARDQNTLQTIRRGEQLLFNRWVDFFLENYSQPPIRAAMTHHANIMALKHLKPEFGEQKLAEINADDIERYLRWRLRQRNRVHTSSGYRELGIVKATTVHQEFRVLRRIFSVAVKKKLCPANPCAAVEFPTSLKGLFRPHYVTWSEQLRIEAFAPAYLANVIRIVTETGLRVYKELTPMRKDQVDLVNAVVWIPESKTPNGVAEVPLTEIAVKAFRSQLEISGIRVTAIRLATNRPSRTFGKRLCGELYDLRSTYATRLSAGGVADEWVTQLLRQGDSQCSRSTLR